VHKNTLYSTILLVVMIIMSVSAQQKGRSASIKNTIGEVKVRKGKSPKWIAARPNMPLRANDAVRTFVESEATLRTSEGTIIKLGENATFEIQELSGTVGGSSKTSVKILTGSLAANVKKLVGSKSSFEFETPTAVAAIRGTKLGIDVKDSKTSVKVYEGKVYVKPIGADKGAEVKADQMTTVAKGQKTVKIIKMEESDKVGDIISTIDTISDTAVVVVEDSISIDTTVVDSVDTDTLSVDSTDIDTVSTDTVEEKSISLTLASPVMGQVFLTGTPISVSGKVSDGTIKVVVDGKDVKPAPNGTFKIAVKAMMEDGEQDISVEATYEGQSESLIRTVSVKNPGGPLFLNIDQPTDGQIITEALVQVRGRTSPGAEVSVSGNSAIVSPDGSFRIDIPIADEEGEVFFDVETTLGSATKSTKFKVEYIPNEVIELILGKPAPSAVICDNSIQISADVRPADATVSVNGQELTNSSGKVSGFYRVGDETGDIVLEFEVETERNSKSYPITISYDPVGKSCNTEMPEVQPGSFPLNASTSSLAFTVFDRTPEDEITFTYTVDGGGENSENGSNGSRFNVSVEEGKHSYSVWATDLAGNRSNVVNGEIILLTKAPLIALDEPSTNYKLLHVPPAAPGRNDVITFDLSFTVENLPDDNGDLLNLVAVAVAGGETKTKNKFYGDSEFDFSLKLKRGMNNITITVKDKNERQVETKLVIEVR